MKILLVEDDATTVESIKLCFQIFNPESTLGSTDKGEEALKLLRQNVYDAVIIDLGLPDMDGTEVIHQLRGFSSVPVMVLSARHSPEGISSILSSGADEYITKPFQPRQFLESIKRLARC